MNEALNRAWQQVTEENEQLKKELAKHKNINGALINALREAMQRSSEPEVQGYISGTLIMYDRYS